MTQPLKVRDLIKRLKLDDIDPEDYVSICMDNRLDKIALVEEKGYIETQIFLQRIKGMQDDYMDKSEIRKSKGKAVKSIIIVGSIVRIGENENFDV